MSEPKIGKHGRKIYEHGTPIPKQKLTEQRIKYPRCGEMMEYRWYKDVSWWALIISFSSLAFSLLVLRSVLNR